MKDTKDIFRTYLFNRHYLVHDENRKEKDAFSVKFALANLFGIHITSGSELLQREMISFASKQLGTRVPPAFYKGFPKSVRQLTPDELLFDQIAHYVVTYGFGHFERAGHSIIEEDFGRLAFKEKTAIREFSVITEAQAMDKLAQMVRDLLTGSRPLNDLQYTLVSEYIRTFDMPEIKIGSKHTALRLLLDLKDIRFAGPLSLSDVIKVVDELNYRAYRSENVKKLNLKNRDRKFISALISALIADGRMDLKACYEKKALWSGLLHHLHYKPESEAGQEFAAAMRGAGNRSVYSAFEREMAAGNISGAVHVLKEGKGSGALMRQLNYIISRCESPEDFACVAGQIGTGNVILLIQLLQRFSAADMPGAARTFSFNRHGLMKVHQETGAETGNRKSIISETQQRFMRETVSEKLKQALKNRLGRVYIDPAMKNYALPLGESTSQGGFGVMATGTRIHIGTGKKIRAFTYWEKVNDIDLSVIGLDAAGRQYEFSWRTMAGEQSDALTYSGDQTSGYYGGSEFYDVDPKAFMKRYPGIRYLVFCDNVFSGVPFDSCICRAGYMLRDTEDSGEIYEPKTVTSAFAINCSSTFAYLFGFDLVSGDLIWLNKARSSSLRIAGDTSAGFLIDDFHITDVINVYSFFEMMAVEIVPDPAMAQVIVTDRDIPAPEGCEVIREYDFERMISLMNAKK